jgi:hypothetical protein
MAKDPATPAAPVEHGVKRLDGSSAFSKDRSDQVRVLLSGSKKETGICMIGPDLNPKLGRREGQIARPCGRPHADLRPSRER